MRHLAALLYQALRNLLEAYTEAASITDRPGPNKYAEYGTAAFAEAAGANDEELSSQEPPHARTGGPSARGGRPGRRRRPHARSPACA